MKYIQGSDVHVFKDKPSRVYRKGPVFPVLFCMSTNVKGSGKITMKLINFTMLQPVLCGTFPSGRVSLIHPLNFKKLQTYSAVVPTPPVLSPRSRV